MNYIPSIGFPGLYIFMGKNQKVNKKNRRNIKKKLDFKNIMAQMLNVKSYDMPDQYLYEQSPHKNKNKNTILFTNAYGTTLQLYPTILVGRRETGVQLYKNSLF